jgi:hypothetical protein
MVDPVVLEHSQSVEEICGSGSVGTWIWTESSENISSIDVIQYEKDRTPHRASAEEKETAPIAYVWILGSRDRDSIPSGKAK